MLEEAAPLRLDLGCGKSPREGFEGVDMYASEAKHKVDLFKFPFPWEDSSVAEIHCSHFIEHLPLRDVEPRDVRLREVGTPESGEMRAHFVGRDFLFAFMDECWRVLVPGGQMHIVVPSARSDRAFQDPTHRRFINQNTFAYFSKATRESMGLGHYQVECDFQSHVVPIVDTRFTMRHPAAQERMLMENWNIALDFQATLKSLK